MGFYTRYMIAAVVFLAFFNLSAQLKGEISQGDFAEYALAVSSVVVNGQTNDSLAQLINETMARDLEMTGYFQLLDQKSFIEKPEVAENAVNFKNWITVGAQGLIKGFASGKDNVELDLMFFDVPKGKKTLHKKYKATQQGIRQGVHSFVKELALLLTGEKLKFFSSRIVFIEKTKGSYSLVVTDFDGANRQEVLTSDRIIALPRWSSDGQNIYFTYYEKGEPNLYSIEMKSKKMKLISDYPGLNTSASASPNGKQIALRLSKDGNAELYLMDLTTKKIDRLTNNIGIDTAPSFSPDGKEITFVSDRSGNPQIYRLFVNNTSRVERLTEQGKYNQDPNYSPDGKYIAFTGRDEKFQFDIFLFDVQSRAITRVTQNQKKNENPTFSPEGRLMVFSSDRTGTGAIFVSNIKGDKQMMIYKGKGEAITPCWSPETATTN